MIKIDTLLLKEILSKMSRCAGNDKNVPLTQLLHIYTEGNKIMFLTTDEINAMEYTYTDETIAEYDKLDVAVLADSFIKLVSKFSSSYTEIGISDKSENELLVSGNGDYKLSLPLNSEGKPIKFPVLPMIKSVSDVISSTDDSNVYFGDPSVIVNYAKFCEGAITKVTSDLQVEDYPRTNYYFGEVGCVTLDGYKATWVDNSIFNFNALIYPSTIKLLPLMSSDNFSARLCNDVLYFSCNNIKLYSKCSPGIEAFPYEPVLGLLSKNFESTVSLAASAFVSSLDRLKLFITSFDENCIRLKFSSDGMFATTMSGSCCEQLSAESLSDFECIVDVDGLVSQLKCFGDSIISFGYGDEAIVTMVSESIKQLVVLSSDETE